MNKGGNKAFNKWKNAYRPKLTSLLNHFILQKREMIKKSIQSCTDLWQQVKSNSQKTRKLQLQKLKTFLTGIA